MSDQQCRYVRDTVYVFMFDSDSWTHDILIKDLML